MFQMICAYFNLLSFYCSTLHFINMIKIFLDRIQMKAIKQLYKVSGLHMKIYRG